jgi:hypothetical protein
MAVDVPTLHPVPDGPLAYRSRIRRLGPVLALAVPVGALILAGLVGSSVECTARGCATKGAAVIVLLLGALPTALLTGIPWNGGGGRYFLAIVTSGALWLIVGAIAARSATEAAVASWRDWWREYLLLAGAVWLGVVVALGVMALALTGTSLL